jgi:hypothetical protein
MSLPGIIAAIARPLIARAGGALGKIFVRTAPGAAVSRAMVRQGPVIPGASVIHTAVRPTSPLGRLAGSSIRAINLASVGALLTGSTPGIGGRLKTAPRSNFEVSSSQWGNIVGVGGYSPAHSYNAQVPATRLERLLPLGLALAAGLGAIAVGRRKKKRRRGRRATARRFR